MRGVPLLVTAAGAVVTIASGGCRPTVGNLMPPPQVKVCVEVEPARAEVRIEGRVPDEDGCVEVYDDGGVNVQASAPGYAPYQAEITEVTAEPVQIVLEPE